MIMYLACDTFMENHLTTLDSTFFVKLMPENQGHSGRCFRGGLQVSGRSGEITVPQVVHMPC